MIQQEGTHANVYVKYGIGTITNYGTIGDSAGNGSVSFGTSGGSADDHQWQHRRHHGADHWRAAIRN